MGPKSKDSFYFKGKQKATGDTGKKGADNRAILLGAKWSLGQEEVEGAAGGSPVGSLKGVAPLELNSRPLSPELREHIPVSPSPLMDLLSAAMATQCGAS